MAISAKVYNIVFSRYRPDIIELTEDVSMASLEKNVPSRGEKWKRTLAFKTFLSYFF